MQTFSLAPSDFAYLLDDCPRCFWLKCRGVIRPREALPKVFRMIDESVKKCYTLEAFNALGLPAKAIVEPGRLLSQPIPYPELQVQLQLRGFLDRLLLLKDDTYAVTDFKTSQPTTQAAQKFWRQLMAYSWCLERPVSGPPREVSQIGLVFFEPNGAFVRDGEGRAAQKGIEDFYPLELDRARFTNFLDTVAEVAAQESMPDCGQLCATCIHVAEILRYQHT